MGVLLLLPLLAYGAVQVIAQQASPLPPVSDTSLWQWFATLGVGGVLAAGIFLVYRQDTARHAKTIEDLKTQHADTIREISARHERTLEDILRRTEAAASETRAVIKENTVAVTHNTAVSSAMIQTINRIAPDAPLPWKA